MCQPALLCYCLHLVWEFVLWQTNNDQNIIFDAFLVKISKNEQVYP